MMYLIGLLIVVAGAYLVYKALHWLGSLDNDDDIYN
jgi:hypothetical protein